MQKYFIMLLATVAVLCCVSAQAVVVLDDGVVHIINAGNNYPADAVDVKNAFGGFPTSVAIYSGGIIGGNLRLLENSSGDIFGGSITGTFSVNDDATASIYGGSMAAISINGVATLNVYGGSVGTALTTIWQSVTNIYGNSFTLDGNPAAYGSYMSMDGNLAGTLSDGSALNVTVVSTMNFPGPVVNLIEMPVPEPGLASLLGVGALTLYRRKRG